LVDEAIEETHCLCDSVRKMRPTFFQGGAGASSCASAKPIAQPEVFARRSRSMLCELRFWAPAIAIGVVACSLDRAGDTGGAGGAAQSASHAASSTQATGGSASSASSNGGAGGGGASASSSSASSGGGGAQENCDGAIGTDKLTEDFNGMLNILKWVAWSGSDP